MIITPDEKLDRESLSARPMASPAAPNTATSDVVSTPIYEEHVLSSLLINFYFVVIHHLLSTFHNIKKVGLGLSFIIIGFIVAMCFKCKDLLLPLLVVAKNDQLLRMRIQCVLRYFYFFFWF